MKSIFSLLAVSLIIMQLHAQTPISAVSITSETVATSHTYSAGGITYNWGVAPNNTEDVVNGFTAGGFNYQYANFLNGSVKLRRVDNARVSGNYSLVWAENVTSGSVYNYFTAYENNMETIFNDKIYNRGTDNLFDNTSTNSNNIERLDYILNGSAYNTLTPAKVGFAVFERGAVGAHDAFVIAAITAIDVDGNPSAYSNVVRVAPSSYGDPGPNVRCRVLKGQYPADLTDASNILDQSRGGVFVSLNALGIAPNQDIYGYSLFADDLPVTATPADLVDYTNPTFFPTNTGDQGGIDLVGITGIFIEQDVTPTRFVQFSAVESNDKVQLKWVTENESSVDNYEIERSADGLNFVLVAKVNKAGTSNNNNAYYYEDNISQLNASEVYYRIKQYDHDRSFYYTRVIVVKRSISQVAISLFPNPVQDVLNLSLQNNGTDQVKISIINSVGTLVRSETARLSEGNNYLPLTGMDRLPAGIYYLSVKWSSGKTVNKHFLKK